MDTSNERITLRLEKENVDDIDSFLEANEEYRSRSELCRIALDRYIKERREEEKPKGRPIRVRIPARYYELMESLVDEGYHTSVEAIINKLIMDHFTQERLKGLEALRTEMDKASGKPVISLGDRDELIPR